MEPESQKKIEETVLEILKSSNMAQNTEYTVRKMASEELGLDLSAPDYKLVVMHVLEAYLAEHKFMAEPGPDDDNNAVKLAEDDEEEEEDDEAQRKRKRGGAKEHDGDGDGDGDLLICKLSERRRVTMHEFRGKTLVSMRDYYKRDGKDLSTSEGISLPTEQWSSFKKNVPAIEKAIAIRNKMTDNASSAATSVASVPAKSDDPAWAHAKIVVGKRNNTICLHCSKHLKGGGITRLKQHLAGIKGQVDACKKVPPDVKWQMKRLLEEYKRGKQRKERVRRDIGRGLSFDEYDENDITISPRSIGKDQSKGKATTVEDGNKRRKQMSCLFAPRTTLGSQSSIRSALASKEVVDRARMAVARWWYDANVPFNAALSHYYQPMIDAMLAVGPGFKGPSYHDLRCSLLNNNVCEIREYLLEIQNSWKTYGCSVMSDGWTNQKQVPIINFMVYCPKGTMFLKSFDTSGLTKDADTLFGIFDEVVQLVGPSNIVQFVTDNESTYKVAGKRLQEKYGNFFWSPCAAHCLDLMLENLANPNYFPHIDATIQMAKRITRYIYNHAWVVNTMRKDFTNGRDLCRPGITRFATNFLTLQCFLNFKKELRQMFTSDKWLGSRYAKGIVGREIAKLVLEDGQFWSQCQLVVKISEPLVRVLRLVDGDEKPTMGYLYEAMDKAKEAIKVRLNNRVSSYNPYTRVIDARWDKQLHSPLHAAGCLLNPGIFFRPSFTKQKEVARGLLIAITVLVPDDNMQDLISSQLEEYKQSTGDFGMSLAIRQRERLNPVAWWEQFGNDCPELQKFAIRILSQCCGATGCERNWGTFEFIHFKKRNRLEHKRLSDLVFVRYNLKLRERNFRQRKYVLDPISLDNIDLLEDWVSEEPSLLDEEDLVWENIEPPSLETLTLEDTEPNFDDGDDNLPNENESQYNLGGENSSVGGDQDPYNYVE